MSDPQPPERPEGKMKVGFPWGERPAYSDMSWCLPKRKSPPATPGSPKFQEPFLEPSSPYGDQVRDHPRPEYEPLADDQASSQQSGLSEVECKKDQFRGPLDDQHFAPQELRVIKVVDNFVLEEGKHEEKQDQHGFISRLFVSRYAIPDEAEVEKLESYLSSDGVLTVVAPRKMPQLADKYASIIQITFTGQPATAQVDQKEDTKSDSQEGQHQQ